MGSSYTRYSYSSTLNPYSTNDFTMSWWDYFSILVV